MTALQYCLLRHAVAQALRLNVELARGFRESESCVAAAAMRLDALCRLGVNVLQRPQVASKQS